VRSRRATFGRLVLAEPSDFTAMSWTGGCGRALGSRKAAAAIGGEVTRKESNVTGSTVVYSSPSTLSRRTYRGVSGLRVIDEANAKVSTIDLADLLCGPGGLRRVGEQWVGLCPLPDHADKTPSFTIYPATNSWWCFGCLRGGDAVELSRLALGYGKHDAAMAAAQLLHEYGHEIPPRPASWHAKQRRQRPVRERIHAARAEVLRRRLFRVTILPLIRATTPDEHEYRHEVTRAWQEFRSIPVEDLLGHYDHLGGV
jgi:hypothetical protein